MYHYLKRLLDIMMSFCGILILSPLLLIVGIIIKITSQGNILFCQKRIGKNCTYFMIYKFRTMYQNTPSDVPTHLLPDPQKLITPIGRILRKTSLDELPQLLNILKGDMSVVGPRPALWNQYDLIAERDQYGANSILPGLTGWAQVCGRDELPIDVKAKYDGEYAQKMSFLFDMKIIFFTAKIVLTGRGIVEGNVVENTAKGVNESCQGKKLP